MVSLIVICYDSISKLFHLLLFCLLYRPIGMGIEYGTELRVKLYVMLEGELRKLTDLLKNPLHLELVFLPCWMLSITHNISLQSLIS